MMFQIPEIAVDSKLIVIVQELHAYKHTNCKCVGTFESYKVNLSIYNRDKTFGLTLVPVCRYIQVPVCRHYSRINCSICM